MKWNWQIDGWPRFSLDPDALKRLEAEFLTASGLMLGVCGHLESEELDELRVELMSDEALKTSEIEGEHLQRASVQSSIRRQWRKISCCTAFRRNESGWRKIDCDRDKKYSPPVLPLKRDCSRSQRSRRKQFCQGYPSKGGDEVYG